jgi:predicted O-methyltransferase YrrM
VRFEVAPAARFLAQTAERFDLVFLDGSHKAWAVYEEVALALRVLRPGGAILLHDYFAEARPITPDGRMIGGPFWAMQRIAAECPAIAVLPFGRLPWPARQGTPFTSLALVLRR